MIQKIILKLFRGPILEFIDGLLLAGKEVAYREIDEAAAEGTFDPTEAELLKSGIDIVSTAIDHEVEKHLGKLLS